MWQRTLYPLISSHPSFASNWCSPSIVFTAPNWPRQGSSDLPSSLVAAFLSRTLCRFFQVSMIFTRSGGKHIHTGVCLHTPSEMRYFGKAQYCNRAHLSFPDPLGLWCNVTHCCCPGRCGPQMTRLVLLNKLQLIVYSEISWRRCAIKKNMLR